MEVTRVENKIFTSNSYITSKHESNIIWIVDPVDLDNYLNSIFENHIVKGVFITHSHYDHIYGLNMLNNKYPELTVYISEYGKEGLYSEKLNLSFYHENPIVYNGSNTFVINENQKIELYDNCFMEIYETPGHNPGCLTFLANNFLFTGDSYIPNIDVVTKLKGGNIEDSKKSLNKIRSLIEDDTIVCPGHGNVYNGYEIKDI